MDAFDHRLFIIKRNVHSRLFFSLNNLRTAATSLSIRMAEKIFFMQMLNARINVDEREARIWTFSGTERKLGGEFSSVFLCIWIFFVQPRSQMQARTLASAILCSFQTFTEWIFSRLPKPLLSASIMIVSRSVQVMQQRVPLAVNVFIDCNEYGLMCNLCNDPLFHYGINIDSKERKGTEKML